MSGMQASRAIAGYPKTVIGWPQALVAGLAQLSAFRVHGKRTSRLTATTLSIFLRVCSNGQASCARVFAPRGSWMLLLDGCRPRMCYL
jgi:hypothetical protein